MASKVPDSSEHVHEAVRGSDGGCASLPRLLRMFWMWSAVAFVLMLVVSALEYRAGFDKGRWDPWARPFMDLQEYPGTYKLLHTADFFDPVSKPVAYPPFAAVVMTPMYARASPAGVYLVISVAWIAVSVWGVRRELMAQGICGWTATLFPASLLLLVFLML